MQHSVISVSHVYAIKPIIFVSYSMRRVLTMELWNGNDRGIKAHGKGNGGSTRTWKHNSGVIKAHFYKLYANFKMVLMINRF